MTAKQNFLRLAYPMLKAIGKISNTFKKQTINNTQALTSIYDYTITTLKSEFITLNEYRGKKILFVNTASDCGFTAQYEALQNLYSALKDKLIIIGFPANDFKNQEAGDDTTIAAFCEKYYGVQFPLSVKTSVVKGEKQHLIYQWLTNPKLNGWNDKIPTWNFCKYLVDEAGNLKGFYEAGVEPSDIDLN